MSLKRVKWKITVLRKISTDADVMDSDVTAKELIPARIIPSSGEASRYFSNDITSVLEIYHKKTKIPLLHKTHLFNKTVNYSQNSHFISFEPHVPYTIFE